jgi:hypothetical protein
MDIGLVVSGGSALVIGAVVLSSPGRIAALRVWFSKNGVILGIPLAILFAAALAGLVLFPLGPSYPMTGAVKTFGVRESDTGTYPVAVVSLPGGPVTVPLPRGHSCRVGSLIRLQWQRRLWGVAVTPEWPACPAPPP